MMNNKYDILFFNFKLFILFSFLFLSACATQQPQLPRLPAGATIVAFGDSLTYGTGTSQENSYPAVLQGLIGFHVINAGVPGETTAQSLLRLPGVLENDKPALVILCIGGNDMLHRIPPETIADNLKKLISMIESSGSSVVVMGVPAPDITVSVPDFYETVAKEQHVPVNMKLLRKLLTTFDYKSDALHLNTEGYRAMAEGVAAFLKEVGAIA
jgi:lysophospholipase L1-like esterase